MADTLYQLTVRKGPKVGEKFLLETISLTAGRDPVSDIILNDPPVLLLFAADRVSGTFAGVNANLALHNAALAAEAVGLGCFYCGFVVIVSERGDSIAKLVGLPETHQIYGALAMGYPRLKFKKWPERNPAKVTWLEAA